MREKEEKAIVLDYLPYGYPLEKKMTPLVQAVGTKNFTLLELIPRRGVKLEPEEEVYIGEGKREKIYYISGKVDPSKLTETAKSVLNKFIEKRVDADEQRFIEFFNTAEAINTRLHQFELLPGFGKKHTIAIIEERKNKPFKNFEDIKKRISNIPDPKTTIVKRITGKLGGKERYNLFT